VVASIGQKRLPRELSRIRNRMFFILERSKPTVPF
jgi:hypothetical protein